MSDEEWGDLNKRTEALEKKYKLQTIANGNLIEQIAELKELLNEVAQSRIGWEENIEKVLREGYIHNIGWIEKAFKIDNKMNLYSNDQKWHLVDSHVHAKKQLEKLDSGGEKEKDIRAITIQGNLYWMPKTEANELIEEFLKVLKKIKVAIECKHGWNSVNYHINEYEGRVK